MRWAFVYLPTLVVLHHLLLVYVERTIWVDRHNHLSNICVDSRRVIPNKTQSHRCSNITSKLPKSQKQDIFLIMIIIITNNNNSYNFNNNNKNYECNFIFLIKIYYILWKRLYFVFWSYNLSNRNLKSKSIFNASRIFRSKHRLPFLLPFT